MPIKLTRLFAGNVYITSSPPNTIALLQVGGNRGDSEPEWAVVDADLIDELRKHRWSTSHGYATRYDGGGRGGRVPPVALHRWIMGLEPGDDRVVDHINRDQLDNRRANLRVITRGQNLQNLNPLPGKSSAYRGVRRLPTKKPLCWLAQCKVAGKLHRVGRFATEVEAAEAARAFRLEHLPFATD